MRIAIVFLILFPFFINAQSQMGQKYLNAGIDFNKRIEDETALDFQRNSANLTLGYMFSDQFDAGLGGAYSSYTSERLLPTSPTTEAKEQIKSTSFSVAPFISWYKPLTGQLTFSLTASAAYRVFSSKRVALSSRSINKGTGLSLNISPSCYYALSEKWSVGAGLGRMFFSKNKNSFSSGTTIDSQSFGVYIWEHITINCRYIW